ncbi:asparagine synthase (glutamine-hydrolyzing) [Alcanivorax marinus]|uniref:asparagine synthase (glutamine-hydrolyzing) n=1 Tax=Alloalcanivorax marinus TaxID=1177169 RepID=A0A9Q3UQ94_9GAMM|nr:asparagine synthase (glutamine-hydrolyzing) [Alloalcanivorax marinus]MCC4309529.1 asparagine synthase (glutamine-hydrolyzing) [Alloalcanivorax marinus]
MCGLAGFFSARPVGEFGASVIESMVSLLRHRGPNSQGAWTDDNLGLALGHRRLAIVDLSPAGHQPMHSACGRYIVVFNGEIYNHLALRSQLRASGQAPSAWRGCSDTETLLAAFSAWGVETSLQLSVGMFAFALWDRQESTLVLARDRFGEKPLYYGFARGAGSDAGVVTGIGPVLFGSELKALAAHPDWRGTLAQGVLEDYLRFGAVVGESSIFQGVAKLPPGTMLTLSPEDVLAGRLPVPVRWWSAERVARAAKAGACLSEPEAAVEQTERALSNSVRARMLADVPLGAFLSGGIDSSLVVALMQRQAETPVRTFSVGFDDRRYDESGHAEAVAAHLGTEHMTLQATSQMALDLVPALPDLYDEPFADSSQLPTALISRLTREHVTVALSGDGGDELFGGYNRHVWVPRIWSKLSRLPLSSRRALGRVLKAIPPQAYDQLMHSLGRVLSARFRLRTFGEKLHKLAAVLESSSEQELFYGVASMNRAPSSLLADRRPLRGQDDLFPVLDGFNSVEWMLLMDTLRYMVDDVLVKVDRASMASSLEVRVPFLDPEVFATAWRIPTDIRLRDGTNKWVLRQVLYRHVPKVLIDRPKMGFAVPLDAWLRGPLRDWTEDLLSSASLAALPMLDAPAVRGLWEAHLRGRGHYAQQLWAVLQLLAWQRRWAPALA